MCIRRFVCLLVSHPCCIVCVCVFHLLRFVCAILETCLGYGVTAKVGVSAAVSHVCQTVCVSARWSPLLYMYCVSVCSSPRAFLSPVRDCWNQCRNPTYVQTRTNMASYPDTDLDPTAFFNTHVSH